MYYNKELLIQQVSIIIGKEERILKLINGGKITNIALIKSIKEFKGAYNKLIKMLIEDEKRHIQEIINTMPKNCEEMKEIIKNELQNLKDMY